MAISTIQIAPDDVIEAQGRNVAIRQPGSEYSAALICLDTDKDARAIAKALNDLRPRTFMVKGATA